MKKNWIKAKPTEPGAYWVKGFNLGRPASRQVEALVEVKLYRGKLYNNLHEHNSNEDMDDWSLHAETSNDFKWCGPLLPHNAN